MAGLFTWCHCVDELLSHNDFQGIRLKLLVSASIKSFIYTIADTTNNFANFSKMLIYILDFSTFFRPGNAHFWKTFQVFPDPWEHWKQHEWMIMHFLAHFRENANFCVWIDKKAKVRINLLVYFLNFILWNITKSKYILLNEVTIWKHFTRTMMTKMPEWATAINRDTCHLLCMILKCISAWLHKLYDCYSLAIMFGCMSLIYALLCRHRMWLPCGCYVNKQHCQLELLVVDQCFLCF